jgi:cytochrome c556
MNIIKKITIITSVALSLLIVVPVNAENHEKNIDKNSTVTFKKVMQGLLLETKKITQGIVLENFELIEKAAGGIVKHPKPAMSQRKKLMKALGSEIANFKTFDHVVHGGAVKIAKAAKDKNMVAVIDEYQKLITGCQSCHSIYKARLSKALQ